jgi:hypothetical protein
MYTCIYAYTYVYIYIYKYSHIATVGTLIARAFADLFAKGSLVVPATKLIQLGCNSGADGYVSQVYMSVYIVNGRVKYVYLCSTNHTI